MTVRLVSAADARRAAEQHRADFTRRYADYTGGRLDPALVARWWPLAAEPPRRWRDVTGTVADFNRHVAGRFGER